MKTKSRSRIKHAVLVLVALAGLGFSLAAAAQHGKIEILRLGQAAARIKTVSCNVVVINPWLSNNPRPSSPGDRVEF